MRFLDPSDQMIQSPTKCFTWRTRTKTRSSTRSTSSRKLGGVWLTLTSTLIPHPARYQMSTWGSSIISKSEDSRSMCSMETPTFTMDPAGCPYTSSAGRGCRLWSGLKNARSIMRLPAALERRVMGSSNSSWPILAQFLRCMSKLPNTREAEEPSRRSVCNLGFKILEKGTDRKSRRASFQILWTLIK